MGGSKMRIAIFTEVFLPKIDGITNRLRHTLDELIAQGHEVLVFGPEHAQESYRSVRVIRIGGLPFPPYPELQISAPDPRILRELGRFEPDVVHVVGPACLGIWGIAAARLLRIPLVASYHTDYPAYLLKHGLELARPAIWPLIRTLHNAAQVNLCPSRFTRDELESHGIEPVGLWRGGVDTKRFHPDAATQAMRRRLLGGKRVRKGQSLAIYVGRVSPEKDLELLFDIHDAIPGLHFALVGDGPDRERLEAKASGRRIHFTGFLRGEELAAAYASADLFVMPSSTETLGFVVLEAMSAGIPAVAAAAGGIPDLVSHGENGLLFDPARPEEAIEHVRTLIRRPTQRAHLGLQARKFAETGSWHEETRRLVREYKKAIVLAAQTDLLKKLRRMWRLA